MHELREPPQLVDPLDLHPATPGNGDIHVLATRAGALALGFADAGSIQVGYKADITLLDLEKAHVYPPGGDVVSRIVYAARASDVHTVVVDGKAVVAGGELLTDSIGSILTAAKKAGAAVAARAA